MRDEAKHAAKDHRVILDDFSNGILVIYTCCTMPYAPAVWACCTHYAVCNMVRPLSGHRRGVYALWGIGVFRLDPRPPF